MKLSKILDLTNFQEKTSFYKIVDQLINSTEYSEVVQNELNRSSLKEVENDKIEKVFSLVTKGFESYVFNEVYSSLNQYDIIFDILIRDGNSILDLKWLHELYKRELFNLQNEAIEFAKLIETENKEIEESRRRDYNIYKSCVEIAFNNDEKNNLGKKITPDEFSILKTLSDKLNLSNQEVRLIHFIVIPFEQIDENTLLKQIKELGVGVYSKKTNKVYIADDIIKVLRKIRNKQLPDKYFRRILKNFRDKEINQICKNHSIQFKSVEVNSKIKTIINQGISLSTILTRDVLSENVNLNDRKKELNAIMVNLGVEPKGLTLEDKANIIIEYFNQLEKDEKAGISIDGYIKLCKDMDASELGFEDLLSNNFEYIDERNNEKFLNPEILLDHGIKPKDLLELVPKDNLRDFCTYMNIKTRGDLVDNILEAYTDAQNHFIENYIHLGNRDINTLKQNGINLSVEEIGLKYEEITKRLLADLGFVVDEDLRKKLSTAKDKIDILIKQTENEVILVECKTAKSNKYNKFSQCSRQMKSYHKLLSDNNYKVTKSLLIAPDFTSDFIDECEVEMDLNLSLISSDVLLNIWEGFKKAPQKVFPVNLLMRDALINDEKILKALKVK